MIEQYIIADGNGAYIRKDIGSGKYVPVRSQRMSEKFTTYNKANCVLKNSISKEIRNKFHVEKEFGNRFVDNTTKKNPVLRNTPHVEAMREISNCEIVQSNFNKWKVTILNIAELIGDSKKKREMLQEQLSSVDKEITDIQHYIEFTDLNASQGWIAYKMLQNKLKSRRHIKNDLKLIEQVDKENSFQTVLAQLQDTIYRIENQQYEPRVLTELFS